MERLQSHGRVATACGICRENSVPYSRVPESRRVLVEGISAYRRVEVAGGVVQQCPGTDATQVKRGQ